MSLRWFLIIGAICFLAALSGVGKDWLPKTKEGRIIVIGLITLLVLLAIWVGWMLLPFVGAQ